MAAVLTALAVITGLCVGGILAGNNRSRELMVVAIAGVIGIVVVGLVAWT